MMPNQPINPNVPFNCGMATAVLWKIHEFSRKDEEVAWRELVTQARNYLNRALEWMDWPKNYVLVDGQPVHEPDIQKWYDFWSNMDNRRVVNTSVGPWEISTVFLGSDHRFYGDGPPVLWETMVFGLTGDEEIIERYTSQAEARAGHERIVARLQDRLSKELARRSESCG